MHILLTEVKLFSFGGGRCVQGFQSKSGGNQIKGLPSPPSLALLEAVAEEEEEERRGGGGGSNIETGSGWAPSG